MQAYGIAHQGDTLPFNFTLDDNSGRFKGNKKMQSYGIAHVWAQGDFVTRAIAITLLVMSVLWIVIVIKGWNVIRLNRLTKNAEQAFWHSDNFDDGVRSSASPHRRRTTTRSSRSRCRASRRSPPPDATAPARSHGRVGLGHALPEGHDGRRHLAQKWSRSSRRSTAPFVGLFGTVWGSTTPCSRSAHPARRRSMVAVGESLIMTAFGLFVAIPPCSTTHSPARTRVSSKLRRSRIVFRDGASLASSSTRDGLRLATRAS